MDIVLASASPRRAFLLRQIGVPFNVVNVPIEEGVPQRPWVKWVQDVACRKAEAALDHNLSNIILAADTVVVHQEEVLGKPANQQDAYRMLKSLSGLEHQVITGICVIHYSKQNFLKYYQDAAITRVFFKDLSEREIKYYLATEEPMDKAGAYGIQGMGGLLVERIEGCYYNVVGLPLVKTMDILRKCGIEILGEKFDEKKEPSQSYSH